MSKIDQVKENHELKYCEYIERDDLLIFKYAAHPKRSPSKHFEVQYKMEDYIPTFYAIESVPSPNHRTASRFISFNRVQLRAIGDSAMKLHNRGYSQVWTPLKAETYKHEEQL